MIVSIRRRFSAAAILCLSASAFAAQPYLVKDIFPGGPNDNSGIVSMVAFQGRLFFGANDGVHGCELWVSDGTNAGTYMVKDIAAGPYRSLPNTFAVLGNKLLFQADDRIGSTLDVYATDGTTAGTVRVADLAPGVLDPETYCSYFFFDMVASGGKVFYVGETGSSPPHQSLYVTDGTPGGTHEVGPDNSWPSQLTDVNGTLFFEAGSPSGDALWKSNGTNQGTVMVYANNPLWLTNVNGLVFYNGSDNSPNNDRELWVSDGTGAGTHLVKDILINGQSWPDCLANVNGRLYFRAFEFDHGEELWTSDGTEEGTVLVADIDPGNNSSDPCGFTPYNGFFLLAATTADTGRELWRSDGTPQGTTLVKDICPGSCDSSPRFFTEASGLMYFAADDGVHGEEFWATDGTEAGTRMIADIYPGPMSGTDEMINVNGIVFILAGDDQTGAELWAYDTRPPPIPVTSELLCMLLITAILGCGIAVLWRRTRELHTNYVLAFRVRRRIRNTGTPTMAVTTPIGNVALPSCRPVSQPAKRIESCDAQSQMISIAPPSSPETGMRMRQSEPKSRVTICGTIKPTNPMGPQYATTPAVANVHTRMQIA